MVWARQQKVGKQGAKFALVVLGELCDDEGQTTRSQGYIASILECGSTAIRENLGHLEKGGWIKRERRMAGSRRLSDLITLNIGATISVDLREPTESEGSPEELGTTGIRGAEPTDSVGLEPTDSVGHKDKHLNLKGSNKNTPSADAPDASPELGPTGYPMTTQGLVAEWVDHCNPRPLSRVIGQMSREIKNCLAEGADFLAVRNGVIQVEQKGLSPATLPSIVHSLQQAPRTAMQPAGPHQHRGMATGTQRALQAVQAGAILQQQHEQIIAEGNTLGSGGGRLALGEGSRGGQQASGCDDRPDVVGNPRPFAFG